MSRRHDKEAFGTSSGSRKSRRIRHGQTGEGGNLTAEHLLTGPRFFSSLWKQLQSHHFCLAATHLLAGPLVSSSQRQKLQSHHLTKLAVEGGDLATTHLLAGQLFLFAFRLLDFSMNCSTARSLLQQERWFPAHFSVKSPRPYAWPKYLAFHLDASSLACHPFVPLAQERERSSRLRCSSSLCWMNNDSFLYAL
jgi:hypothetical protein